MKYIKPILITDATLISSDITEDDEPVWVAATDYSVGELVIRSETHRIYENLIAGIDSSPPEISAVGATPRWLDIGPVNRWAMFDQVIGSISVDTSPWSVTIAPGRIGGLSLLEVDGINVDVSITDGAAGAVIYTASKSMDDTVIKSFYDFFFSDLILKSNVTFTDIPSEYNNPYITITVAGNTTASIGVCAVGLVVDIGDSQYGARIGIEDYSIRSQDAFGRYSITEGNYSRTLNVTTVMRKEVFNLVFASFVALRATPAVYILVDKDGFEQSVIYGFYSDFSITIEYQSVYLCNSEIKGIV